VADAKQINKLMKSQLFDCSDKYVHHDLVLRSNNFLVCTQCNQVWCPESAATSIPAPDSPTLWDEDERFRKAEMAFASAKRRFHISVLRAVVEVTVREHPHKKEALVGALAECEQGAETTKLFALLKDKT
jgi:hypothetical protein